MPIIRLPDGSERSFDNSVTVADVAASIGAGLARAALAGKVNGNLVDTSYLIEENADLAIVTDRDNPVAAYCASTASEPAGPVERPAGVLLRLTTGATMRAVMKAASRLRRSAGRQVGQLLGGQPSVLRGLQGREHRLVVVQSRQLRVGHGLQLGGFQPLAQHVRGGLVG